MEHVAIKDTAFAKFLRSLPREFAIGHLLNCLANGPCDNAAWELWEVVHGDNRHSHMPLKSLPAAVGEMLDYLSEQAASA